jgi:hypothetical protein
MIFPDPDLIESMDQQNRHGFSKKRAENRTGWKMRLEPGPFPSYNERSERQAMDSPK